MEEPTAPLIIPRSSWWANELYTSLESTYWDSIIEWRKDWVDSRSPEKKKKDEDDSKRSIDYINENFSRENTVVEKISYDLKSNFKLAWPLKYTETVDAIVIHHTHSEYEDSLEWMKDIYRYHSLNRQWWDIWYNYVIGYDGEIFEWRKWGDYSSAAHSKWNNFSTLWIAVMGNYGSEWVNEEQYKSLETLVKYLAWKYGIDFSEKHYYHMKCAGEKCNTFPLETYLDSTLVWHRDTWHTSCPWDKLYEQIQKLREDNLSFTSGFEPKLRIEWVSKSREESDSQIPKIHKMVSILAPYSQSQLSIIYHRINELLLDATISQERRKKLQILRLGVILSQKNNITKDLLL